MANENEFNPIEQDRISITMAMEVKAKGVCIGAGSKMKDCYWSGYTYDGKHYLLLNNWADNAWEVSEEQMKLHIED